MEHPEDDVLFRFLQGAASRQENRLIVRHLLSRCPRCAKRLRTMRPEPPLEPGAYDPALDRFAARLRELAGNPKPPPRRAPANLLTLL
jgi:hypothetical protein